MKLNPYLNFNGQCKEAFELYAKVLGGKIEGMMTWGESPAAGHAPAEMHDKILHAYMVVGDQALMASDSPPENYEKPQGTYVAINLTDTQEGQRIFDALAENGTVQMPFEKTFWADGFGMLVDRFGTPWMVNCSPASS